ncbi:hypothetical protein PUN28_018816 [Cardiocondyla obscurior]|uniref:Uncharacterized protein n=1 Tax=Cardiocondyla obscurior TaxID=286306 RepID=A0AAW2EI38_9HYME
MTYVISRIRRVPAESRPDFLAHPRRHLHQLLQSADRTPPRVSLANFPRQDYISSVTYYRPSCVLSRDEVARRGGKKLEKKRTIKRDPNVINIICKKCNPRKDTEQITGFIREQSSPVLEGEKKKKQNKKLIKLTRLSSANGETRVPAKCLVVLFAQISSATVAVAYYSYLGLKRYARAFLVHM